MFIGKQTLKETRKSRAKVPADRKVNKRKARDITEKVSRLTVFKPTTTISKADASNINKPDATVVSACIRCKILCCCLSLLNLTHVCCYITQADLAKMASRLADGVLPFGVYPSSNELNTIRRESAVFGFLRETAQVHCVCVCVCMCVVCVCLCVCVCV